MRPVLLTISSLLLAAQLCLGQRTFTEVAAEAGINHKFEVDMATFGGGVAVLDFDKDGFEDFYITGGVAPDALYHNNGNGTFTNVFEGAGFDRTAGFYTQGVVSADVNRDGFRDLFITTMNVNDDLQTLAPNLLYLNNGDGTFTDATEDYGLENFKGFSTGATFGDINADGFPDLYVSNYLYLANKASHLTVLNEAIINSDFIPAPDFLFINAGGKFFVDAADMYHFEHTGYGFQGLFTDFDNDRDLDLYIANDFGYRKTPNILLRNQYPRRMYSDETVGLAMNFGLNAMGIARADINFDGYMDYFVTNISTSLLSLNQQATGQPFKDVTYERGVALAAIHGPIYNGVPVSWGANFFDYDHDTDMDLFIANGALNPTYRLNPNLFYECDQFGYYHQIAERLNLYDVRIGRGSVVFDYDNDGDLDILVVCQKPRDNINLENMPPPNSLLFRNDASRGNWLKVALKGVQAEADGIGSRVEVVLGDKKLIREIDGGSSHLSQNSTIAHFGLRRFEMADSVIVKWVGGHTQVLTNVAANQLITIEEEKQTASISQDVLEVFPTQFSSTLNIAYELAATQSQTLKVEIINTAGQQVAAFDNFSAPAQKGFFQWQVPAGLASGLYVLRATTQQGTYVKKVVRMPQN